MTNKHAVHCYRSGEAMGTRFEVFLRGEDEAHLEAVAIAVLEEIVRLDQALSRFDPRSEIARINRDAVNFPVRVDRELFALLARCEQARELTEGYFDITHGKALCLEAENCTVRFGDAATRLDLGGVGKGYALDCGREILLRYGVRNGLLQGGTSSVLAIGNDGWRIAVRQPNTPAQLTHYLELRDRGFSCSAVRHVEQRESDVVNPLTGEFLTGNDACVVLAANATDAEIFSTALLAMGRTNAQRYLEHNRWQGRVGWVDEATGFVWLNVRDSA